MEEKLMGYKKKFFITDRFFYVLTMFFPIFILFGTIQAFIFITADFFSSGGNLDIVLFDLRQIWFVFIYLIIIFILRKFYYYEMVKYHMKEKYNFSVSNEEIEILSKKGSVQILISDIEKVYIYRFSSPFKNFYKLSCKMLMTGNMDSNFCKDVTTIKIKIKNDIESHKYKNRGVYYNLFNYNKVFGAPEINLFVYEIMYDSESEKNIDYLKQLILDY